MHSHQNNISEKQAHIIIIKLTSIEIIVVNQIEITQPTKEYKLVTYFSVGHMNETKYNLLHASNYEYDETKVYFIDSTHHSICLTFFS